MSERRTDRRLERTQQIKIVVWVQNNEKMIREERLPFARLADMVGKELGFEISPHTISGYVREFIPDYKPKVIGHGKAGGKFREWKGTIERKISDLEETLIKVMDNLEAVRRLASGKQAQPIPASTVPNPKTIPLANAK